MSIKVYNGVNLEGLLKSKMHSAHTKKYEVYASKALVLRSIHIRCSPGIIFLKICGETYAESIHITASDHSNFSFNPFLSSGLEKQWTILESS